MYDIFFIDQGTPGSLDRWDQLKYKFPHAQKTDTVQQAVDRTLTRFAWIVDDDCDVHYNFEYVVPKWDGEYIHRFKQNNENFLGIYLIPKKTQITNREWQYQFFTGRTKDIDVTASSQILSDIVFISYNEPFADVNYENLLKKYPGAKRVHGVKGIHQAHIAAAKLVTTPMFWAVDADAEILENFSLDYYVPKHDRDVVHVWRSQNPINNLEYGYGGVKLLPTQLTLDVDVNSSDMTTSISKKFKAMPEISNITAFATDPFNTWRSAFRECVKLASKRLHGQVDTESEQRLDIWCTVGKDAQYGKYALDGAGAGKLYGLKYQDSPADLAKINDFEWLKEQFDARRFEN
jgi:hypothetical protein